jgi:hypothetical protein
MRRAVQAVITSVAVAASIVGGSVPASALVPNPADDPRQVTLSALTPSTSNAYYDRPPVYENGCHASTSTTAASFCTYGDPTARKVMVAFGDSHLAQWWGALDKIARQDGYRLLWATKSACPAPVVAVRIWRTSSPYTACTTWRKAMIDKIAGLHRLDMLVMSGYHWHQLRYPGTNTLITDADARARAWRDGYTKTVRRLKGTADHLMILRDTMHMRRDIPSCMAANGGSTGPCTTSRRKGLSPRLWQAEQAVDASFDKLRAWEMTRHICRADGTCRPVTSTNILRYRDDTHLTTTFVRAIAPKLRELIQATVATT